MIYSTVQILAESVDIAIDPPSAKKPRRRPRRLKRLDLTLEHRQLRYTSLEDFSFAIECRTSVPGSRFYELFEQPAQTLWDEAESIKAIEKRLVDILEDTLLDGATCGERLRDIGVQIYSHDHDWRTLMQALLALGDEHDVYKRLALIKYLQYLGARQDILRTIFARQQAKRSGGMAGIRQLSNDTAATTVLFDSSDPAEARDHLTRLPRGEAVRIYALPGHAVDIRLARHRFQLINDNGWLLRDVTGRDYAIAGGLTVIGRGRNNDVNLPSRYAHLSRRHLIAEPLDDHVILVTDLSSHGTFAPGMQMEPAK